MTWEELVERAEEKKALHCFDTIRREYYFEWRSLKFTETGLVKIIVSGIPIAKNKTPDQMYQIMLALED